MLLVCLLAERRKEPLKVHSSLLYRRKSPSLARSFAQRMFQGKCQSAFQLLEEVQDSIGVLGEDDVPPSVSEALRSKHPDAQGLKEDALYSSDDFPPLPDQVIFECIDAGLIRHAAKQTHGSGGEKDHL